MTELKITWQCPIETCWQVGPYPRTCLNWARCGSVRGESWFFRWTFWKSFPAQAISIQQSIPIEKKKSLCQNYPPPSAKVTFVWFDPMDLMIVLLGNKRKVSNGRITVTRIIKSYVIVKIILMRNNMQNNAVNKNVLHFILPDPGWTRLHRLLTPQPNQDPQTRRRLPDFSLFEK